MLQQILHWLDGVADRRRTLGALQRLDHRLLADIGVPEDRLEEFADPRARARAAAIEREDGYAINLGRNKTETREPRLRPWRGSSGQTRGFARG